MKALKIDFDRNSYSHETTAIFADFNLFKLFGFGSPLLDWVFALLVLVVLGVVVVFVVAQAEVIMLVQ